MPSKKSVFPAAAAMLALALHTAPIAASGAAPASWSTGQAIYVPVYSHIYIGNREQPFYLTSTVSIRNSDPTTTITVTGVDYVNSSGYLVKRLMKVPLLLRPLASIRYVINESDKSGGSGASCMVTWKSAVKVSQPIVESVMIGTSMQQGISFTSRGQVVRETAP
jgi:hypothetical protein